MTTLLASTVETAMPWDQFRTERWAYRQGQHVTLIGPTGRGKSTLALALLPRHMFSVVFRNKRRDKTLDRGTRGFTTMERWDVHDPDASPRVVLAPPLRNGLRSVDQQRQIFREALEAIYRQGGWTVYLDELRYMTDFLGLQRDVELLLQQGRSLGIGVWSCVQRPRHVPLLAYDQAGHIFIWHNSDLQAQDRLGELAGGSFDSDEIEAAIDRLDEHEVLHLDTWRGQATTTKVENVH